MAAAEDSGVSVPENVRYELDGRLSGLSLGKYHLSVRYEPDTRLVRVGACIANYNWENRELVIDALLDFEESHDEFALEFDVIPLEGVKDAAYAEV